MLIAVISDTHGTLHPDLIPSLREARPGLILHAGDVGNYALLIEIGEIAPVYAVRGNIDVTEKVRNLPEDFRCINEGIDIYLTHIGGKPKSWLPRLPEPTPQVAICGHSHIPIIQSEGGVLFLNPGSAGTKPRFGGPLSFALLRIEDGKAQANLITLQRAKA